MKVIPTILTTTLDEFKKQMHIFPKYYSRIQLDVADGKLVPNTTVQIGQMVDLLKSGELKITEEVAFDFHLMVESYEKALEEILEFSQFLKVDTVLINAKFHANLDEIQEKYPNFIIGLDISSFTSIDEVELHYNLSKISAIQIMSIESGFQGNPFIPQLLDKIQHLREKDYRGIIFMDGGINDKTLPIILEKKYKPDFACIGSYLTKAEDDLERRIEYLKTIED